MDWETAIAAFVEDQRDNDLAPSTIDMRRWQLRHVARMLGVDPFSVTRQRLRRWATDQAKVWKADTRRSHRTTLRAFYSWAAEHRLVEESPALALKRVKPAQPNPQAAPDQVYLGAIAAAEPREALMMRLAAIQGLRCCEVAVVHTGRDVVEDEDAGWSLLVHGKGDRERLIALEDQVARELRSLPAGWAFPSQRAAHLTAHTVGQLCNPLLPGKWTMHKLRHRAGTRFYHACGMDMRLTAAFLGHTDTKTTMIYVEPDARRMRAAVNLAAAA